MSDIYLAEIRIVPYNFAPKGWAFCNGQLIAISQNTALFSLLGTTYGGDGKSNFALPNLQGQTAIAPGQGPGLSQRFLGELGGSETVTLLGSEMPQHRHGMQAQQSVAADVSDPSGAVLGAPARGTAYTAPGSPVPMAANAVSPYGSSQPHNNLMPYLTLNFVIALTGQFPPRP